MASYSSFKRIATDSIIDGSIATVDIANNAATTGKFQPNSVTADKIANNAVADAQLTSSVDISSKTVTYRPIIDGDIASGAGIASGKLASNASTVNLGYTPVNRASGTMTGVLRGPNGSVGAPSFAQSGNTNTGIWFDASNNVYFSTGGNRRMTVTAGGQVTKGTSPTDGTVSFQADGTAGWLYNNSFGGTGWRHINSAFGWSVRNRGGTNCDGNGIFTAPVAGFYQFLFQTYGHNDAQNAPNYIHLSFGRNGGVAFAGGRIPHGIFAHGTTGGPYPHGILMDLSTYLNASDNIRVFTFWGGNQMRFHAAHSIFDGSLIC